MHSSTFSYAFGCTFLVALQQAAAGEAGDAPCDRRCGLKLTCGALNRSFTCEMLTQWGSDCDCSGCCSTSLVPSPAGVPGLPAQPEVPRRHVPGCTVRNQSMGVAVCLGGFVRTLAQRDVHESLSRHFRAHLPHAEFFGVVSSGGQDTAKGQHDDVHPQDLESALKTLEPVEWEDTYDDPRYVGHRCGLLCMRQFDRMQRCSEMIAQRERQCGGRFDWVVKACRARHCRSKRCRRTSQRTPRRRRPTGAPRPPAPDGSEKSTGAAHAPGGWHAQREKRCLQGSQRWRFADLWRV